MKQIRRVRIWLSLLIDFFLLAVLFLSFAYFHHVRPTEKGGGRVITVLTEKPTYQNKTDSPYDTPEKNDDTVSSDTTLPLTTEEEASPTEDGNDNTTPEKSETPENTDKDIPTTQPTDSPPDKTALPSLTPTPEKTEPENDYSYLGMGAKFHDKFSRDGKTLKTENSYISKRTAIYTSTIRYLNANVHIADIYICDISSFRTALAKDKFGNSIAEQVRDTAERKGAILAINGDNYGYHINNAFTVKNGMLYSDIVGIFDICALYSNGEIKTYKQGEFDPEEAYRNGLWQTWSFGPRLLENGKAITDTAGFNADDSIVRYHPRTVLGYYQPGHYCFVCVDGRSSESRGMSLVNLSKLMEYLGCTEAYNLDGGDTSVMYFQGNEINVRSGPGTRRSCDSILIMGD